MKKRISLFMLAMLAVLGASAQMIAYSVQSRIEGTPGEPTVVDLQGTTGTDFSKQLIDNDGNLNFNAAEDVACFPIGFDFGFNSQAMKYFVIGTDGFIQLSPAETITTSVHQAGTNLFSNAGAHDVIGLVMRNGFYGYEDTEISYWTEGVEGSRALAVQWKNVGVRTNNNWEVDDCAKATVIIRLYEKSGNIEIKTSGFKPYEGVAPGNYNFMRIGILGDANDRVMVLDFDGTDYTAQDKFITYSATAYPQDGTVYTFVAPEACVTPTVAPTGIVLTSTTTQITGTFDLGNGDHYLVLATTDDALTETPADKTKYAVGDEIGNAKVIANVDRGEFASPNNLEQGTYNVFIYSYNSLCMNGPLYSAEAGKAAVTMKPGAPAALTVTSTDKDNISLKAEDSGATMVIAMTAEQHFNSIGQGYTYGEFGTPAGSYNVGDEIEGGGKVIYIGNTADAIGIGELTAGKPYFFRAWSTDGQGGYSSEYLDINAVTAAELPWQPGWETAPTGENLLGWTQSTEDDLWYVNDYNEYHIVNKVNFLPEEGVAETWTETCDIYLNEGSNWLGIDIAANTIPVRWAADWEMAEGDQIAIQVTADGVEYKDILVLDKDNMPEYTDDEGTTKIWKNGEYVSFRKNFTDYAGQKVRLRFYVKRASKGEIDFKNIKLEGTLYGIVGTIPGLTWDDDLFLTQSTDNKNLYTASLDVTVDEVPAEAYAYKLRANQSWDGYQLPAEGNQYWQPTEAGDYTLVFTADVAANTLSLSAQRPFEVSFKNEEYWTNVYAYTFTYDSETGTTTEYSGAWPGTKVEVSGGWFSRSWTYNFTAEQQPQYIIWNNGGGYEAYGEEAAQTADFAFVNGKTYSVYPEITSVKISGSWNGWNGEEMTVTEYNDKAFQTTVNLTSYTEDQEFKLVVNGEWIGSGELEKIEGDAASSITEGDTGSNLKLKAGKGYDIVAFWSTPSASVKNGWILEIVENTTVDIDAARVNAAQKQTIHNLKGIQLQKQQRGVNIVNGKKITVK